ncbi:ribonuclease H-like domain, reverse transcriptase, RNA-dependent DNA polymerase [Tanacetum coccineum]
MPVVQDNYTSSCKCWMIEEYHVYLGVEEGFNSMEEDLINDPNSPITPPTHTYNPHSEEEEEATISSMENSGNRFVLHSTSFKILTDIYKKWIEAMEIELDSINKNNTWTLTTLPPDQKAIGLKWVYKTKRDAEGKIIKYKARLVAKGYVQEQGIDFDEVFAPVARIETVRLILALAAYHGWQVHHLDVKSAFLHGDLKEEVYVTQPEGFIQQGNSGKVYKLIKALYGLRQAPRAWNMKLDQTLKSLDFKKCNLEQAVYTRRSKTSTLIVGVYVDDLIITGTPRKEIDAFNPNLMQRTEGTSPVKAVKQVIRFYSDSSYGINTDQGKGTTGIVFYFGESPITWCTQKQPTVALSSCESEFMAATGAASIALVKNPVFHGRSKHIDIRYHFIRECVENGHINVEHVSGELQRADILTKALPRLKSWDLRTNARISRFRKKQTFLIKERDVNQLICTDILM